MHIIHEKQKEYTTQKQKNEEKKIQKKAAGRRDSGGMRQRQRLVEDTRRHWHYPTVNRPLLAPSPSVHGQKRRSMAVTRAKEQKALWRMQATRRTPTTNVAYASGSWSGRRWRMRLKDACFEKSNGGV